MNKEEALLDFLKGLRVAINNSLAYSRKHPYFLKSAQEFKEKIDNLFNFLNPIKVNVSPESLFLDGKYWNKIPFSLELAQTLHQRKIKGIEFKPGLGVEELADFLNFLSLQPKELFKNGGLVNLLKNSASRYICVEELDYSGFLGTQGEEAKDIWVYMFKDAMEKNDPQKIGALADNFLKGAQSLSLKAVIDDGNLRKDLGGFLGYLKDNQKDKFSQCAQELSKIILGPGSQVSADNVDKLKEVFKDLDGNDFAELLVSHADNDKDLSALNIGLFSQLAGKEHGDKFASSLADKVKTRAALKSNPALLRKIKDLLSVSDSADISPTYRNSLASLVKNISFKENLSFDRSQLKPNYRVIILNLLIQEKSQEALGLILERLHKDWPDIVGDCDYGFLKSLMEILKQKNKDGDLFLEDLEGIEKKIAELLEQGIWNDPVPSGLAYLADTLRKGYSGADFYLNKIFQENNASIYGIKLFLKFFPVELELFYKYIDQKRSDLEFLSRVISSLAQINMPVSAIILKEIFSTGNEIIKAEVLKAMRVAVDFDAEFILPLLQEKSAVLKREALAVLLRDAAAREKSLDMLLGISSPWGTKNRLILENLKIIEELDLREASRYLIDFSKRKFFWNKELRLKAIQVLGSWK